MEAVSFFLSIAKALLVGYAVTAGLYAIFLYLITRMSAAALMHDGRPSTLYHILHMLTWATCAAAGAYVCCGLAPIPPYGLVAFPMLLCLCMVCIALRTFLQLPGQVSVPLFTANISMIVLGTAAALFAHHALPLQG